MVGSLNGGFPLGQLITIGASSQREFPGSCITMHLIKERVRQGQQFAFVSYESEIDWTKYDHIFDPK
ncbi:hypothetical protein [Edwardsiella phage PEi26]|uniref:Uncharacterized protein n=1 Tax=Edwardsiella phage PEi26 TaxID=1608311 RepID=A0A0B6VTW9_9CAUD|nr:hypothetical protein [Edwardsiella phage PEi26]